ncbi:TonB-dependent receptor [Sphingorhabdus sp. EL138]|uniref:TonB-dependent receptor n=1 Tax=Sphingorhabdus sp. EL138 TaxID=2073156 RepID=UPI0020B12249|nr:TonB-dependent receptor [Sphingorhabdus sp. EL138]
MKSLNRVLMAALCTSAMTVPAYAQDQGAEETVDDNVIIVTATRRAEDVQDIPIAVTAVSPVQLEQQGVVNVQNIGSVSPSFSTSNAQTASGTVVLRIRGVGTTSNNIGFESAVGIFVDGAYQSRPGVALGEFVDVERVEVLRGPQGTLFGRNTSAGALNITNKRPDLDEFGGFVNATYGNFDHISVQGAINAPIIEDTLAFRLTGAYRQRDGFVDVVDSTGNQIAESNETDQYLVRGQLGFESDSGIQARLIADYSQSTASCCSAVELLRSGVETSGLFAAVGLGLRGGQAGVNAATSPFDTGNAQLAVDDRLSTESFPSDSKISQWGITGELEFPLGDNADLIYIGSYREFEARNAYDSDFSGIDVFNVIPDFGFGGGTEINTMTHELRVQGEAFDGALDWLVGAYYSDEDISQTANFGLGADYDRLVGALLAAGTGGATLNPASPLYAGGATFLGATPLQNLTGVDPSTVQTANAYTQNSKSWSIFTHNTLEVADGLKLTVGLRYSDESKDGSFSQPGINNNLCPATLGQVAAGNAVPDLIGSILGLGCFAFTAPAIGNDAIAFPLPRPFDTTFSDEELIYTGKVSYEFASPVTIYASFTHGYKSGGFNLDSTAAAGGADPRFASEEVDAYEVGLKAKFLDNAVTLNVAGFHEEFTNFQVLEFTGAQFRTFNVPVAKSTGVELETVIRPDDNFTINGGLTYTDARYPGNCAGTLTSPNVVNLCGNSLTNAPKWVGIMGATYDRDLGSSLKFFVNGQIRMESDRRTSTQASLVPNAAQITAAGSVQAAAAATALNPFDIQDSNIKINMRAGIGDIDDAWGIEAWVTNLTNEVTRGVTFNTVLRSGSRSAFVQEPRMFGLTLRGKF